MKTRITSNPDAIIASIIAQCLTRREAAQKAEISTDRLTRVITAAVPVRISTAGKLRRAFGADAIKIIPPAQG